MIKTHKNLIIIAVSFLTFITIGFPIRALGTAWNKMYYDFSKLLEDGGLLFSINNITTALVSFIIGHQLKRFKTPSVIIAGYVFLIFGMYGYSVTYDWNNLILFTGLIALGVGFIDITVNSYAAKNYTPRQMNWLHASWGIGATISSAVLAYTIKTENSWRLGYTYLYTAQILVLIMVVITAKLWKNDTYTHKEIKKENKTSKIFSKNPLLSMAIFFFESAATIGLGMWLASGLIEGKNIPENTANSLVVVYWTCIMIGRFCGGIISVKIGSVNLIKYGMLGGLCGSVLMIFNNFYIVTFAIAIYGLSLSVLYPTIMHHTNKKFEASISSIMVGYQAGSSLIGGAVLVPLIGYIMTHTYINVLFPILSINLIILIILNYKIEKSSDTKSS